MTEGQITILNQILSTLFIYFCVRFTCQFHMLISHVNFRCQLLTADTIFGMIKVKVTQFVSATVGIVGTFKMAEHGKSCKQTYTKKDFLERTKMVCELWRLVKELFVLQFLEL